MHICINIGIVLCLVTIPAYYIMFILNHNKTYVCFMGAGSSNQLFGHFDVFKDLLHFKIKSFHKLINGLIQILDTNWNFLDPAGPDIHSFFIFINNDQINFIMWVSHFNKVLCRKGFFIFILKKLALKI